ncbi:hypothetical protein IFM89_004196 [Coptis chinensis]|uniref:Cytochrome P450 n=1 Tax=Coptis chinensis TaxID=261450 RepID=A0A835LLE3_9MAGN|nr:hypothetical protein IFM89_004196 [Coptis chinensis]
MHEEQAASAMEIQYLIALVLVILFISYKLAHTKHHHKNLPPGPRSLPIVGHFHLLVSKPMHIAIDKFIQKYGPILYLKFGFRPVLVLSSPTALKECFTKNDIIFANRPQMLLSKFLKTYDSIPMSQYCDCWRNLCRLTTTEIFCTSGLDRVLGTKPFFGEEEIIDPEEGKDKLDELRSIFLPNKILFGAGDFFPFLKWIDRWTVEKIMMKLFRKRDKFMQTMIDDVRSRRSTSSGLSSTKEDTREERENKGSMMDVLFTLQEAESEHYTDDVIKGVILVMFGTGIETSTTTMEWAMALLLNHPEVLKKATDEIDLNVGYERLLNESDFVKLPYLQNIIYETLRMCSLQPFLAPHESTEDCTIGGYDIPKGTMLLVNQWALHKDSRVWSEPTMFKPERFEKGNEENDGIKWIPFGEGRRACPGDGLAMRTMGMMLGVWIQCFDWERLGGEMVDMSIGERCIMSKAKPLEAMSKPKAALLNVLSQI